MARACPPDGRTVSFRPGRRIPELRIPFHAARLETVTRFRRAMIQSESPFRTVYVVRRPGRGLRARLAIRVAALDV